ncbi:MAG: enoyl-CoA hydratase-related protein [Hymenobacteraceae bacterium]|nr:enoyl-CoA hydratase-related protein [Hymenobacteraceae bacterium]MDX5397516.1 enoyl-CoA hydratase-related protein [Hymenobacteraceae bacterium]MDX5443817.1 enoyl-CoA hydratase-related protein [Hymenobacteraceae bacterium]MDX5513595.1 enoyl-CoA hydratase-related protein [Hymenobacteraceae bacterium]
MEETKPLNIADLKFVRYDLDNRIGYITLNRPDKRNALNHQVVAELKYAFKTAEEDEACKVIVLRAEGKVFCAGADLEYLQKLQEFDYNENLEDSTHLMELFLMIYTLKKVVIGQIHGHAIAGGCGLATICDFAFTVPDAKFGYTEVKIGFLPAIVKVFLLRKIGEARAKQLLLSGDLITAQEAQHMGLVNWVVSEAELPLQVYEFAQKLCRENSQHSMEITKEMISRVQEMTLEDGLRYAAEMNAVTRGSEDCQRGISAFLNKEKLEW